MVADPPPAVPSGAAEPSNAAEPSGATGPNDAAAPPEASVRPGRPSKPALTVLTLLGVACLAWAHSFPGLNIWIWLLGVPLVGIGVVGWLVLAVRGWHRRLLLGPLAGVVVLIAFVLHAPLHARWELSRNAFEDAAAKVPLARTHCGKMTEDTPWPSHDELTGRIGSYSIFDVQELPCGLLFFERIGNFIDYAGFAYLPGGPEESMNTGAFEVPEFQPLGGGWYAWTASW